MHGLMIALFTCSITMSVLALLYMAATPLLAKQYSAKGRYYAWLVIVIGLIIPFRPHAENAIVNVAVPPEMELPIAQVLNGAPDAEPIVTDATSSALPSISLWQVSMVLWIIGMIVFLAYHAIKHYRFVKLAGRWSERVIDEQVLGTLNSLKAEMDINKHIELQICTSIGSPMMTGFINPKVLLPKMDFAKDDLRFILTHELVHYKRKDLYYKVLVLLATAVHWFNPVVYMMAKAIDIQCELSCDDEVIRSTDMRARQQYGETIIGVVRFQSKIRTSLSTNFYGGKNGMRKRIFSIMDMNKKKAGAIILCGALILTLGTGFAFAATAATGDSPETTAITNVAIADETPAPATMDLNPLSEYADFGITYAGNGDMLFNGQTVRYFWDGYEIEPGMTATHYDYLNEDGIVDIHTIRSVIDNGDGSFDMFGELLDIVAYSKQEFDARDIDWIKGTGRIEAATAVGDITDAGGRTFEEIFAAFKDYDIKFVASTSGGIGNVYYKEQLVKTFVDEKNDGSVFTFSSVNGGNIIVRTVYDAGGNLTGVKIVE